MSPGLGLQTQLQTLVHISCLVDPDYYTLRPCSAHMYIFLHLLQDSVVDSHLPQVDASTAAPLCI